MTTNELKQRVYAAIDRRAEEIIGLGERIRKQPELGFKEIKTARLVEDTLAGLGLKPKAGLALTGVRADAPGHAGGGPHMGVNALYAAQVGLTAVNAIRETFRDEDTIRVHPIITHGGSQVNVIPGEVRLETYVRGRTVDAILDAQKKVDRAFKAGALALGAKVEIETLPGYMPMTCDGTMARRYRENAAALVGAESFRQIGHRTGSTDMGDLSMVMPILHPYVGGAVGSGHGADFKIVDPQLAYVTNAKALAAMAVDMLAEGAAGARDVLKSARPPMTREQYLAFQRGLARRETFEG